MTLIQLFCGDVAALIIAIITLFLLHSDTFIKPKVTLTIAASVWLIGSVLVLCMSIADGFKPWELPWY